jgi:hypothetical protein
MNYGSIAKQFHDTYEALAPSFGYETREDIKEFDPSSPNGQLMVAVVKRVLQEPCEEYLNGFLRAALKEEWEDDFVDSGRVFILEDEVLTMHGPELRDFIERYKTQKREEVQK